MSDDTVPSNELQLGDVITEDSGYSIDRPVGIAVYLDKDGSRRITNALRLRPANFLNVRASLATKGHPVVFWGLADGPSSVMSALRGGLNYEFLPYPPADGVAIPSQIEPVNQIPYLQGYTSRPGGSGTRKLVHHKGWMRHVATFAHEIDTLYADHTHQLRQEESYRTLPDMPHTDESNIRNQNGLQYGRGTCGHNFEQLDLWSKLRGEDGGSGSIATDWKMRMIGVREDVEELCLMCPHPYFLRQFINLHDHLAWRRALDELLVKTAGGREFRYMRCPKIDKTGDKWQPAEGSITTFAGNAPLNWWKRQMVNWGKAVDYYDAHYAARDE